MSRPRSRHARTRPGEADRTVPAHRRGPPVRARPSSARSAPIRAARTVPPRPGRPQTGDAHTAAPPRAVDAATGAGKPMSGPPHNGPEFRRRTVLPPLSHALSRESRGPIRRTRITATPSAHNAPRPPGPGLLHVPSGPAQLHGATWGGAFSDSRNGMQPSATFELSILDSIQRHMPALTTRRKGANIAPPRSEDELLITGRTARDGGSTDRGA